MRDDDYAGCCGGYPGYKCEDWPHCMHEEVDDRLHGWPLVLTWAAVGIASWALVGLVLWVLL